jgi:hypothetical protein
MYCSQACKEENKWTDSTAADKIRFQGLSGGRKSILTRAMLGLLSAMQLWERLRNFGAQERNIVELPMRMFSFSS